MLIYTIESIKAVGGPQRVKSLEKLVENFEKNTGEWRHLSHDDLASLIKKELACLSTKMQQIHEKTTSKIEVVAQDLKHLEADENDVIEEIEVSQQKIVFTVGPEAFHSSFDDD